MCNLVADWSRRMGEAHDLATKRGHRVALATITVPVFGDDGHLAWVSHFVACEPTHPLWLARKGRWTALLAERTAERRVVDRGIEGLERVLAGGEGA